MAYSICFAVDGNIADGNVGSKYPELWDAVMIYGMQKTTHSGNFYWGWLKPGGDEEYERDIFKDAVTYIKDGGELYLDHDGSAEELRKKIVDYGLPELCDYVVEDTLSL